MTIGGAVPTIPGIRPPNEIQSQLRSMLAGVLGRNTSSFPGAQPVSFARRHITDELLRRDYFMCEKTDGIRCLLWLDQDTQGNEACYLIDRKNEWYFLSTDEYPSTHFPRRDDPTFMQCHTRTLLDGELVYDTIGGERILRFLVFDILTVEGENVMQKPLQSRLGRIRQFVTDPYNKWLKQFPQARTGRPFELMAKEMNFPYALTAMFSTTLPNLPHGNDGLVFTCQETPYRFGTDENIIKWKPPHENTIDFRLNLDEQSFPQFDPQDGEEEWIPDYDAKPVFGLDVLHDRGDHHEFAKLWLEDHEWESFKSLNELLDSRILECWRDDRGRWRPKLEPNGHPRFRDDKTNANHISTVHKVIDSINDGVTQEELIAAEDRIRTEFKKRQQRNAEARKAQQQQHLQAQQNQQHKRVSDDEASGAVKKRRLSETQG